MSEATRLNLLKSQARMAEASQEAVTGRYADVGIALGSKTSQTVSFRQDVDRLESITKSNDVAATRLSASQLVLNDLVSQATTFNKSALLYSSQVNGQLSTAESQAVFNGFLDRFNATNDGAYIFAGINTDVKPVTYSAAAATSVQTAFNTLSGGNPSSVTPAAMEAFLADGGPFSALFNDTNWKANWSQASDTNIKSRISTNEMIDTSTNANEQPFRDLMRAATMMSQLSNAGLQPDTMRVVAQRASSVLSVALTGLSNQQATLGVSEQRISDSNEKMSLQKDLFSNRIDALEGVDRNEASVRVTELEQQIELSYAITGKIQKLNILDYL